MPSHRPDFVSVIILDEGRFADTIASIESVESGDWPAELREILVVTSHSGGRGRDPLAALGGRITLLRADAGATLTDFANEGAARARGQYLAFLAAGARAESEWIRQAVKTFHGGIQIGAVASRIVDSSTVGAEATVPAHDDVARDLLFGHRTALFIRKALFSQIGGFDARLSAAYDDVDLGWRINLFGFRVRSAPSSRVHASSSASQMADEKFDAQYLRERNALIVLYKNLDEANLGKFLAGALGLAAREAVEASGLNAKIDPDSNGGPNTDSVLKSSLAGLYGIGRFVDVIGELAGTRAEIQARRTARDEAVLPLFETSGISFGERDSARPGASELADAMGINAPSGRVRVLVITGDLIGPKMAGPAIRAWNMCEQLAVRNDVRLVSPIKSTRASTSFEVFHAPDDRAIRDHEQWADVIVFQGYILHQFRSLARSQKIMVADIYDPLHLEQLEQARDTRFDTWNEQVVFASEVLNEQLGKADFFLCASEKQRDFWLGQLAAVGRINAMTYEADNSLRELVAVAPFGLDLEIPPQQRHAIKGAVPGIGPDDKVLIWGGGVYDWFDTATLLHAMAKVVESHPRTRLFFLGVAHPNPGMPVMKAQAATMNLSDELGLTDRFVFFNREWVAFNDRHNYLLDADAGVSTHFEHIETAFSFRTRILDYLWARLPMVTTRGDGFAELIDQTPLGVTAPEQDVDALAEAIISVLYDETLRQQIAEAVGEVRDRFAWNHALEPLTTFCAAPRFAPDRGRQALRHIQRMPDPGAESIRQRFHGAGKAARLASHYLTKEGPRGLVRRVRQRLGF